MSLTLVQSYSMRWRSGYLNKVDKIVANLGGDWRVLERTHSAARATQAVRRWACLPSLCINRRSRERRRHADASPVNVSLLPPIERSSSLILRSVPTGNVTPSLVLCVLIRMFRFFDSTA